MTGATTNRVHHPRASMSALVNDREIYVTDPCWHAGVSDFWLARPSRILPQILGRLASANEKASFTHFSASSHTPLNARQHVYDKNACLETVCSSIGALYPSVCKRPSQQIPACPWLVHDDNQQTTSATNEPVQTRQPGTLTVSPKTTGPKSSQDVQLQPTPLSNTFQLSGDK